LNPHSCNSQGILSPSCLPIPPSERHYYRYRAENGTRTRDLDLGKVALYQLSYFRECGAKINRFSVLTKRIIGFLPTFSRHGNKNKFSLLIWLIENVNFRNSGEKGYRNAGGKGKCDFLTFSPMLRRCTAPRNHAIANCQSEVLKKLLPIAKFS
jgi:hypothetical protein